MVPLAMTSPKAAKHVRLEHAIRELRRLPYRPLESLRISRERFCLHPFVQQARDAKDHPQVWVSRPRMSQKFSKRFDEQ